MFKKFLISVALLCMASHALYVDFDQSMQAPHFANTTRSHAGVLNFLRDLYNKNNFATCPEQVSVKIPQVIHQIWLGGKLPAEFQNYRHSWIDFHPTWKFVFWTDNLINADQGYVVTSFEQLEQALSDDAVQFIVVLVKSLDFANRGFYDQAQNYGEKSDILKWEIIYRFGGLYVDTDFQCLQAHDTFHYRFDFYTGITPLDTNIVQLGAALYGATPCHPVLQRCVDQIKYNQHIAQIIVKTGPIHFTKCFLATADVDGLCNAVFPASYFYPMGYEQAGFAQHLWRQPESYAVHHWAGSWLKPEAFEKR